MMLEQIFPQRARDDGKEDVVHRTATGAGDAFEMRQRYGMIAPAGPNFGGDRVGFEWRIRVRAHEDEFDTRRHHALADVPQARERP